MPLAGGVGRKRAAANAGETSRINRAAFDELHLGKVMPGCAPAAKRPGPSPTDLWCTGGIMRSTHGSSALVSRTPRYRQNRDWVRGDRNTIVFFPRPHRHPVRSGVRDSLPFDLPNDDCLGGA